LIGLVVLGWAGGPLDPLAGQTQTDTSPGRASFRSVPVDTPYYATGVYAPYTYNGPLGGYLSGGADVINAQGQFMVNQQQAFQQREQVKQARIVTRRQAFDEWLYERDRTPTPEDERERFRLEQVRHSRNDPGLTEIWSGKALNELLLGIQKQQAQRIQGPSVPLDDDILKHINLTSGASGASLGVLKDGGRLRWPLALTDPDYESNRKVLDDLAQKAVKEAEYGRVEAETIRGMRTAVDNLQSELRRHVADVTPNDYIEAKRYLSELDSAIKVLRDPNVSNYVTRKWSAKGDTVAALVQDMTAQGLKFAPAVKGDEAAYTALQRAMVSYYSGPDPSKPWDPWAK
jgi:hypothetical protein